MPADRAAPLVVAPLIWDTVERYFDLLQAHASAERMREESVTHDFRTGFVDGLVWQGEEGLRDFLAARAEFFDESRTVEQMSMPELLSEGCWSVHTRLDFSLRRRSGGAPMSDTLTGKAFHLWEFAPAPGRADAADAPSGVPGDEWRVAAQLVEGFAALDDNARRLFSRPAFGLNLDDR